MSASWYDVLGVAPDATEAEIRAAWKAATSDLEPTDRRFDLYNSAAKVLLDAEARAGYDAEFAQPDVDEELAAPDLDEELSVPPEPATALTGAPEPEPEPRAGVPAWLLAGLALAVLVVAGIAGFLHLSDDGDDAPADSASVREAQTVLEQSFGNLLTYSWDDLEAAHQRAVALLTPRYRCEFDKVWSLVEQQAQQVKPVVTTTVVRSGVSAVSDEGDRVKLVALIRNEVANKGGDQGVGTLLLGVTMVEDDGAWLVDEVDGLEGGDGAAGGDPCDSEGPSGSPSE
ncbi:J domain-containing protein [Nocardioides alcanivorans]|uniref:J domain-containing protein n=1 Tax=Nocardioides alcanivorans TaxID=2897352 RepID=UPI001F346933|nr:J domain-containing protein [Nocardioides alcanivorans]